MNLHTVTIGKYIGILSLYAIQNRHRSMLVSNENMPMLI